MNPPAIDNLRDFFEQYRCLGPEPQRLSPSPPVDAARLGETIGRLAPALAAARVSGAFANIWTVAGLGRNEVRTASVLAWFLDPSAEHGAGDAYAQALWNATCRAHHGFELRGLRRATTEVCFFGDAADRIDLVLEGDDCLILIEVKIDAGQQPDQLERYAAKARQAAALRGKTNFAVLYLSEWDDALPEHCSRLRWTDVARAFRHAQPTEPDMSFVRGAALQFAAHVERLH